MARDRLTINSIPIDQGTGQSRERIHMSLKEQAALAAVELVENGMVLGLGTGSTATLVVREIGRRLRAGALRDLRGVPTSAAIARVAHEEAVPLLTLEDVPEIDLTIDGADEVDPSWNLIKGGGGSLLREKIVAQATRREAIVVDESKLVERLGRAFPLPLEVVPFGWGTQIDFLRSLGAEATLRRNADGTPFVTDEGHLTLDLAFRGPEGERAISDLRRLDSTLRGRAGIVETGLFLGMTSILVVGRSGGPQILRKGE